jgi:periplasmic protein TonB
MLDQLVESKSSAAENKRRFGFLTTTLFAVGFIFLAALTYSLFAKDLGESDEVSELSSLVAPVPITDEKPSPPEMKKQPETKVVTANLSNRPIRTDMYESADAPTRTPTEIGSQKDAAAWVNNAQIGKINFTPPAPLNSNLRENTSPGTGITVSDSSNNETAEMPPAPKPKIEPKPEPEKEIKKPTVVSEGVVNGKATNLVKPTYPLPAKAVRASGAVNVQVLIDEKGNVVSATAVFGHPLLRQAAEQAAKLSKFTPTLLSKVPVKVTGVIVYNFVAQ